MTTASIQYGTATAFTITLASLASDATNIIAGRESTAIDNSSTLAVDVTVGGKIMTGTTPTVNKQIEVWAYGSYDGTTYTAGASGTDNNFSPTGEKALMGLLIVIPTDATSNHSYEFGPCSIAQAFGGVMPKKFGVFVVHNTGVALNATGSNHEIKYTSIKYTSA